MSKGADDQLPISMWMVLPSPPRGTTVSIFVAESFEPNSQQEWDQLKAALLIEQDWECTYCARPLTWKAATFDHLIPRCQEGTHHRVNLAMACQRCNSQKGGRSVLEWQDPEAYAEMLGWDRR